MAGHTVGLGSTVYQDKWEQFTSVAERQIEETGMIKKSPLYGNNPFLGIFKDGYGCECFYNYMLRIPINFDRIRQDLYLTENEMNNSIMNVENENQKLVSSFSSFATNGLSQVAK